MLTVELNESPAKRYARSRIKRLECYNVHRALAVIILLRTCQLFYALIM